MNNDDKIDCCTKSCMRLLDEASGLYMPSFFYMRINDYIDFFNKDIEFRKGDEKYKKISTFIHEYIHYLQDIITIYGLSNIDNIYGRVGCYVKHVFENKDADIKIPIKLDDIPNAELNKYVLENVKGDNDCWTYKSFSKIKIIGQPYLEKDEFIMEYGYENGGAYEWELPPIIKLCLTNDAGETEERDFSFGSFAIIESMASLIEEYIFPIDRNDFRVQYDIVELICNRVSFLSGKKSFMVALCDASLMFVNPGKVFISSIFNMVKNEHKPQCIEEIYSFVFNLMELDFKQTYEEKLKEITQKLNTLLPKENSLYENLVPFLNNCLYKAHRFREERPYFLSNLMEMDSQKAFQDIINVINCLDFTLVIDEFNFVYTHYKADRNILILPTFLAIYSVFTCIGDFKCSNYNICMQLDDVVVDKNCLESPWKRGAKEEPYKNLCAFAAVWNSWNLNGKGLYY